MRIARLPVVLVAALLPLVAACGGDDGSEAASDATPEASDASEAAPDDTASPAADGGTLTVWADQENQGQPIADAASEALGVEVDLTIVPYADLQGQFTQAVSAGTAPDLVITACGLQQTWAAQNLLAPVDLGDAEANMDPAALLAGNWEGETVCVPATVQSIAMHRNTTLVPQPQTDWDAVRETCENWPDDGSYCIGFTNSDDFDAFHVFPVITAYGGYLFDYADGSWDTSSVGVNDPGTREAYKLIADLVASGKAIATTPEQQLALFSEGKLGLWITGSWNTVNLPTEGLDYVIEAAPEGPAGPGRPFVNSVGVYVNGSGENLALAQTFVRNWWLTEDAMAEMQEIFQAPTPWIPLQGEDPNYAGFLEASVGGEPIPQVEIMGEAWGIWSTPLKRGFADGPGVIDDTTQTAHEALVDLAG